MIEDLQVEPYMIRKKGVAACSKAHSQQKCTYFTKSKYHLTILGVGRVKWGSSIPRTYKC
jgi:hypothetical protein